MGLCEVGALKVHPFYTDTAFNSFLVGLNRLSTFDARKFPIRIVWHRVIGQISRGKGRRR